MGQPAYLAIIKLSGTPTTVTAEPMTKVSQFVYRITNAARRVMKRGAAFTLKNGAATIPAANIVSINYLTGTITTNTELLSTPTAGTLTYVPMVEAVGAYGYSLNLQGDLLDDSSFDVSRATGFRTRVYGMNDVAASINTHSPLSTQFKDLRLTREPVIIEFHPGGVTTEGYAGWFVAETVGSSGDIGSLEDESVSFVLDGDPDMSFSYITAAL